ncbi:unnamed protein product, partial [Coregonus sp. 'balchen']
MPVSLLWAVDVYGRVYSLSTGGQQWEQCRDAVLEFKRVTSVQQCCWGIACDHHIYLNVHSSDVPIRYQEEAYENQRWNPVDNFSDRLLPSDRWQWSNITGLEHQPLDSFLLPSTNWEWEGDWYIDENFGGEPTEKEAMDPLQEVQGHGHLGQGWEISEEPRGRLSLWAVSLQGKVWFREGIHHHSPEGDGWEEVSLPGEVVQISCGPGDLVWAVLWEGQLIVREGITRDCPQGSSWVVVDSPSPEAGAIHVAVGDNVVWAVTKDNKVWFRRGINSHNPRGSGWIGMVGEMVMINVGLNDQVWGISCEDRAVYFRQGVTSSELSGKAWKAINVPRDGDVRSHSSASSSSLHRAVLEVGACPSSPPSEPTPIDPDVPKPRIPKVTSDSFISEMLSDREVKREGATTAVTAGPSIPEEEVSLGEAEAKSPPPALVLSPSLSGGPGHPQWSNVDLEEAQTHLAVGPAGVRGDSADTCSLSSVATYTLCQEEPYGADEHPLWAWVSGGGCGVDCHSQLNWFNSSTALASSLQSMSLSISPAQTSAWRKQIFEQFSERSKREMDNFKHYEQAIEQSVWVKKGTMQWWRDWKPHKWVDVRFALEQFSGPEGNKDGILFLYYTFNEEKKYLHAFINEVTILVPVLNDSKHTFAIYTAERTKQRWPIRLAAATELEMHDWLALLSVSCCDSRGIQGPPSKQALWSVTCKGDIFVGGHLRLVECNSLGVVWGVGYDHTAWVYTGGYGGGFFQ